MKLLKDIYFDIIIVILIIFYNYLTKTWDQFHVVGLALILFSLPFWLMAREQLGKYLTLKPKATGLVTSGIYSKFRNPIYIFSSITVFGAILPSKNLVQYLLFFLLLALQLIRTKAEEKVLEKKFGKKYLEYKSSTLL